jgi:hypothetical protein
MQVEKRDRPPTKRYDADDELTMPFRQARWWLLYSILWDQHIFTLRINRKNEFMPFNLSHNNAIRFATAFNPK